MVLRAKRALEATNVKIGRWAVMQLDARLGQKVKISIPRDIPDLAFVEFEVLINTNDSAVKEERIKPAIMAIAALNADQEVVLDSGSLVLRVIRLAPPRRGFGKVKWSTRLVFPRLNCEAAPEVDDDLDD